MTQAGCRLLTLHDMPILRLHFTCVFRVSHGSRTCGMLRTAGSEVLGKDLSFVQQDRELDQELGFDPAVPDLGDLGFEGLGDYVELPRDVLPDGSGTYDNDPLCEPDLTDEEGQLPAHAEGEITNEEAADLMDVDPEPLDRIPEGGAMAFAERFERHEAIGQVAAPVQEGDKGGEIIVELGGDLVKVQRPCVSRDDVTEVSLDLGLTYEGMIKELKALESLSVGDMMWTIDPRQRVISTRWVVAAKNERIDGKETPIVRCRIVARDYSTGLRIAARDQLANSIG